MGRRKLHMQRILIVGTTGSGKSTLAKTIAEKAGLVYIDLDDLHHLPGWQERPTEDFRALVDKATQGDKWVLAGNYSKTHDISWPRADALIWLDIPFWMNFRQLLKRTFRRARTGEPICNGNYETLAKQFLTTDSILLWFLRTWGKNQRKYAAMFKRPEEYPHLELVRFDSYKQAREFTDTL